MDVPPNNPDYIKTYPFEIKEGMGYVIWGRVIAPNGGDDSFWVKVDDGEWIKWNGLTLSTSWVWDRVHHWEQGEDNVLKSFDLTEGKHTLYIAQRENGVRLDQLYITNSGDTPGNIMPQLSADLEVVQVDDYYPFGLTFNSYSVAPENKYKFQGQEHQDETGWDSFKWRNHQPDIGRFFNVDPLAEDYYYNSPYAFSENKVIAHIELEGLESTPFMTGHVASGKNKAREQRVAKNGTQQEKQDLRRDQTIAAIIVNIPGLVTGISAFGTATATGAMTGGGISGGLEALNPESDATSILTKTTSGALGGAVTGGGNSLMSTVTSSPVGSFFSNLLVGALSGVTEELSSQVLEQNTGQRDAVNSAEVVEAGWAGAIGNAIGGFVNGLLGGDWSSTSTRVGVKGLVETGLKAGENELEDAVRNE